MIDVNHHVRSDITLAIISIVWSAIVLVRLVRRLVIVCLVFQELTCLEALAVKLALKT